MIETFPTEPQLFELYGAVFEVLMKCLLVSVAVLFAAAIILIILCCRETISASRKRARPDSLEDGHESNSALRPGKQRPGPPDLTPLSAIVWSAPTERSGDGALDRASGGGYYGSAWHVPRHSGVALRLPPHSIGSRARIPLSRPSA